ncbi:glycoside hydrolase family protein [Actinoplanes sp. NPDC051851]|uniref:glycoside hydrolase family protein n=1 Tax=Actinoplanes sp. NPDC051851 TaxID=3154753 RepID=UPI003441341F
MTVLRPLLALLLAFLTTAGEPLPPARGIGTWGFTGVEQALAESRVTWYYTWSPGPGSLAGPPGAQFVPMIWGAFSAMPDVPAGDTLLGFNEPDVAAQANMTVAQALHLWPALMATGLRLGSPAVSANAATPDGWLDLFMSSAAELGYRVDFIAVHWYGSDPAALIDYLHDVHDRYGLPIWLTEFAVADFTDGLVYAPRADQETFLRAALPMLDRVPYLERYAWFALSDPAAEQPSGLYDHAGRPTALLDAYRSARVAR